MNRIRAAVSGYPPGVPLLFLNSLLMNLGFYSLIPFLSYYLTQDLHWTPALTGVLLMVRQFCQQGVMFLTGMVADRIGYKRMLAFGMIIRGLGFSLFAFVTHPFGLFLAAVITGIGGSMFEPTQSAALKELTAEETRGRVFAVKKVLGNVGIALSAGVGALLMQFDFAYLSLASGAVFFLCGWLSYWRLPNLQVQTQPIPLRQMFRTVLRDHRFVLFVCVDVCYYFLYMQCFLAIPLLAVHLLHSADGVSAVNLTLALMVVVGQVPVNRLMARFELLKGVVAGFVALGTGILVLGLASQLASFLAGLAVFALGVMILEPASFEMTTRLAKQEMTATYFGFGSMALAIGGSLSQGLGGYLLQLGQTMGAPTLLWWICVGVVLAALLGVRRLRRQMKVPNDRREKWSQVA